MLQDVEGEGGVEELDPPVTSDVADGCAEPEELQGSEVDVEVVLKVVLNRSQQGTALFDFNRRVIFC